MSITLNGDPVDVPDGATVADLLVDRPALGVAVAVNGSVVPRGNHSELRLADGDVVEVVTAVQGG